MSEGDEDEEKLKTVASEALFSYYKIGDVEFKHKTFDNLAGLWNYLEEIYKKKVDLLHKHKRSKGAIFDSIQKEVIYG